MVINLFIGRAGIPLPGFRQDALRCPLAPAEEGNLHQGEQAAPLPETLLGAPAQPAECRTTGSYSQNCVLYSSIIDYPRGGGKWRTYVMCV